jgi:hypothetical protein
MRAPPERSRLEVIFGPGYEPTGDAVLVQSCALDVLCLKAVERELFKTAFVQEQT